jgi:hypothetical protein
MTRTVKHTPLPWRNDGGMYANDKCCTFIVGGKDGAHPTIFIESKVGSQKERLQFEANAELIVTAVNSYSQMREALEAANIVIDKFARWYEQNDGFEMKDDANIEVTFGALRKAHELRERISALSLNPTTGDKP